MRKIKPIVGQSFDRFVDDYKLVVDDNGYQHLEVAGKRDLQAEIDSYKDTALDKILDKYLNDDFTIKTPDFSFDDDEIVDLDDPLDDYISIETDRQDIIDYLESIGVDPYNLPKSNKVNVEEKEDKPDA